MCIIILCIQLRFAIACALCASAEGLLARVCDPAADASASMKVVLDDLYSNIPNRSSIKIGPHPGLQWDGRRSIAVSTTTEAALVAFVTTGVNKTVHVVNVSQPFSPTVLKACPVPNATRDGGAQQVDLGCVVWMGDQLYVVYDEVSFENYRPNYTIFIASLNILTCNYTYLWTSTSTEHGNQVKVKN
jgi:hypothetical protein